MATPFPTTYYIGIGTAISNTGVPTELSGGSYARLACAFTGTAISGLTETVGPWVVATAPTPAVPSLYGLMYDSLTGGDLVAYWQWNPGSNGTYTGSLTAFPSTTINITFNTYIQTALNLALQGGSGTTGSLLDQGAQLGTVNGQPLLAGSRLGIGPGGYLAVHLGTGQWIGNADVQNTLFFGQLATSSINNGITALSGGGTAGAVPVLSGFFNRITTSAASGDSCILPPLIQAPVGSIVTVVNNGASISKVWADAGASVNVSGTLTLAVGVGFACLFTRITPVLWSSIPSVAS